MGRRSFDAQGNGSGLAPKQLGEAGEAFADRVRNQIDGDRIGVEALVADSENCIQPGGGRADHPLRPVVEAAPRSFVRELDRTEILLVARRAMPVRLQQAKRALEARDRQENANVIPAKAGISAALTAALSLSETPVFAGVTSSA